MLQHRSRSWLDEVVCCCWRRKSNGSAAVSSGAWLEVEKWGAHGSIPVQSILRTRQQRMCWLGWVCLAGLHVTSTVGPVSEPLALKASLILLSSAEPLAVSASQRLSARPARPLISAGVIRAPVPHPAESRVSSKLRDLDD